MNEISENLSNKLQDLSDFWSTHTAPMTQVSLGSTPDVDVAAIDPKRVRLYMQVINRLPKFKQILKEYNLGSNVRSSWYSAIRDINAKGKYINTLQPYRQRKIKENIDSQLKQNPLTLKFASDSDNPKLRLKPIIKIGDTDAGISASADDGTRVSADAKSGGAYTGNFFNDKLTDLENVNKEIRESPANADMHETYISDAKSAEKVEKESSANLYKLYEKKNKILDSINTHPIYGPNEQKTTTLDIGIFCALTYIIRGIALYLVDWALTTKMISTLTEAFFFYVVVYWIIFGLICALVNTNIERDGILANPFKAIFFYLNTDINPSSRIFVHILIQFILFPIILFISDGSENPDQESYQKQKSILFLVGNLSLLMWFLSAIIAFRI